MMRSFSRYLPWVLLAKRGDAVSCKPHAQAGQLLSAQHRWVPRLMGSTRHDFSGLRLTPSSEHGFRRLVPSDLGISEPDGATSAACRGHLAIPYPSRGGIRGSASQFSLGGMEAARQWQSSDRRRFPRQPEEPRVLLV